MKTLARRGVVVVVNDRMQRGYRYRLTEPARNFDPRFRPQLTPRQMLRLGVFGGKYLTDCRCATRGGECCAPRKERWRRQ